MEMNEGSGSGGYGGSAGDVERIEETLMESVEGGDTMGRETPVAAEGVSVTASAAGAEFGDDFDKWDDEALVPLTAQELESVTALEVEFEAQTHPSATGTSATVSVPLGMLSKGLVPVSQIRGPLAKRGRGRPLGSLNKPKAGGIPKSAAPKAGVSRPRGRPSKVLILRHEPAKTIPSLPSNDSTSKTNTQSASAAAHPQLHAPPTPILPSTTPSAAMDWSQGILPQENQFTTCVPEGDGEGDGWLGLMGDGDGFEGDPTAGEEDEEDLERAESSPKRKVKSLPAWLRKKYDDALEILKDRPDRKMPAIYSELQSFWLPEPDDFFKLQQKTVKPSDFYPARFFVWDPQLLLPSTAPLRCPKCRTTLWRHGYRDRPLRVTDLDDRFFIIGHRYKCPTCRTPSGKANVTYESWDEDIINMLPKHLIAAFPAVRSWRSALSKRAFALMRCNFQHGLGAKQFSDVLSVLHRRKHAELQLQYLHMIKKRVDESAVSLTFEPFGDFADPEGYAGFIPCSGWLRDVYDCFMEEHMPTLNQMMAMLTCEIGAIDHSFKVPKHLAQINGVPVFGGLITVTNEVGEIRMTNLVATKAQAQYDFALEKMRDSLELYGHSQPKVFYTDNTACDKPMLERIFPSLRENVTPVEKYSHLPLMELPNHIRVIPKSSPQLIEEALATITDCLDETDDDTSLVVGFDAEWNVEYTPYGVSASSSTSVIQISFREVIYIVQLAGFATSQQLPVSLLSFLSNPRIIKAGCKVSHDVARLQAEYGAESECLFTGEVELGRMAKERGFIKNAGAGLADIVATVLGKNLPKEVPERISNAWGDTILSEDHMRYAALDAWAGLCLYERLIEIPVPAALPNSPMAGLYVTLWQNDHTRQIAHGTIAYSEAMQWNGVKITKTRILVDITEVLVPGAIVGFNGKVNPLSSFGTAPFLLVCDRRHLKTRVVMDSLVTPHQSNQGNTLVMIDGEDGLGEASKNKSAEESESDNAWFAESEEPVTEKELTASAATLSSAKVDPSSKAEGDAILEVLKKEWSPLTRSLVLKDIFHGFQMIDIAKAHGLRRIFARALSRALFIEDRVDKARIVAYLSSIESDWEQAVLLMPKWLWRRCKRTIPPPEQLYDLVSAVFTTYGPLKDARSGLPLFNKAAWASAKSFLSLVQKGLFSDPPDVPLFVCIGRDYNGLPVYRCMRGTNMTEGGVHGNIVSRMPIHGVAPRHAVNRLMDYVLMHNLLVGTFNRTAQIYKGHYDPWTTNAIQILVEYLLGRNALPSGKITNWINGDLYTQTEEVFGILPVAKELQVKSEMQEYAAELDNMVKSKHKFLAKRQRTRFAVLPLHTPEERIWFSTLMRTCDALNQPNANPDWALGVKAWNRRADGLTIFYKLQEHLQSAHGPWKTRINEKASASQSADKRKSINALIGKAAQVSKAPPTRERPMEKLSVKAGLLPAEHSTDSSAQIPSPVTETESQPHLANQTQFAASAPSNSSGIGQKRTLNAFEMLSAGPNINERDMKKKKVRTCMKCGDNTGGCGGRGGASKCGNRCQDCGQYDCRGRNSQHAKKKCHLGWE